MKYLDLESTRILKVDEIYPYSLQCDACQQIFIREPAAISISKISIIKMTSKRIEEDDMRAVLWKRNRRNRIFMPNRNRSVFRIRNKME
jgi:hypothetical protein